MILNIHIINIWNFKIVFYSGNKILELKKLYLEKEIHFLCLNLKKNQNTKKIHLKKVI